MNVRAPLALVFIACASAGGCGRGTTEEAGAAAASVRVDTAVAHADSFAVQVEALGEVVAGPGFVAEMSAPAESRVVAIYVVPGQRVTRGDSLVVLDRSVWAADVRRAEAAAQAAHEESRRVRQLVDEGILPRKEAEQAEVAAAAADADLAAARRIDRLAVVRSPISGVVADVNAVLEGTADSGTLLVRVVDPQGLEGLFRLTPDDAVRVEPGAHAEIARAIDGQRPPLVGTVRAVSPRLDPISRTVAVRVRLASPEGRLLLGEALAGRLTVEVHPQAVVVPLAALVPTRDGTTVFVVDREGIAHERPVTPGARDDQWVEILEGLRPGEAVVTTGAFGVTDGALLRVGS